MSIGAGIAVAAAFGFAAVCALSKQVSGFGMVCAIVAAVYVAWLLNGH